jgi:hypothetical protein
VSNREHRTARLDGAAGTGGAPPPLLSGRMKNPKRERGDGDRARQDQDRARSEDEIDIAASVRGHHDRERHEDAADSD